MGRPPVGKTAMTAAERMRRYRLKHAAAKPAAKPGADTAAATIAALRKELAAAKAGVSNAAASPDHAALVQELKAAKARIEDLLDEIAALKAELHDTIAASSRFASKPAKPKVEKPPLPPDEERDRTIKGLKTRVRNLTAELHMTREWKDAAKGSGMSFATRGTIMKPLHPDSRKSLTEGKPLPPALEAALDESGKAMNAWLDSLKPARR